MTSVANTFKECPMEAVSSAPSHVVRSEVACSLHLLQGPVPFILMLMVRITIVVLLDPYQFWRFMVEVIER